MKKGRDTYYWTPDPIAERIPTLRVIIVTELGMCVLNRQVILNRHSVIWPGMSLSEFLVLIISSEVAVTRICHTHSE